MKPKIKAGIIGGTGYTGGELIRLLLNHSEVELIFATSRKSAGKKIAELHPDLLGETDLKFTEDHTKSDVLFLCLPHKESKSWLANNKVNAQTKIIDLGNDFRINNVFGKRDFIYGMPEINKEKIKNTDSVANCGCFASAIQYGLLPLAQIQKLDKVYSTGITGSTGAGVKAQPTTHFSWRSSNVSAYKTLTHQHLEEINTTLEPRNKSAVSIHFVPWRGGFSRGIFISSTLECAESLEYLNSLYEDYYADAPFVHISKNPIHLKQVVNTNKCVIQLEKKGDTLVVHSAIDNLLKGASGQAIQNMNLMFGFPETLGLKLKPLAY